MFNHHAFESRTAYLSMQAKSAYVSEGSLSSKKFSCDALSVRLSNGAETSSWYATSKVPSVKVPLAVRSDIEPAAT